MHNELFNKPRSKEFRRTLRNEPTRAEKELWNGLRKHRTGGYKFRRQHGIGPYIADFYCPELRLVIEVDGASHELEEVQAHDAERTVFFAKNNIDVLRFTDGEVLFSVDRCMEKILEWVEARK